MQSPLLKQYKEKLQFYKSSRDHGRETRMATKSADILVDIKSLIQLQPIKLGIKCPLEYLHM